MVTLACGALMTYLIYENKFNLDDKQEKVTDWFAYRKCVDSYLQVNKY